jgi:hypothetical protein
MNGQPVRLAADQGPLDHERLGRRVVREFCPGCAGCGPWVFQVASDVLVISALLVVACPVECSNKVVRVDRRILGEICPSELRWLSYNDNSPRGGL